MHVDIFIISILTDYYKNSKDRKSLKYTSVLLVLKLTYTAYTEPNTHDTL